MESNQSVRLAAVIDRLISHGSVKAYQLLFEKYHEADIADALEELGLDKQQQFFTKVKPEIAVEVLEELDIDQQTELLLELRTSLGAKFIEEMNPDDAVDLLEELIESDEQKAEDIIEALPKKEAKDIQELLAFEVESAGGIMTSEFLSIPEDLTVKQAISKIKTQNPPDSEISFYIFIVDDNNILKGYTTLRNLLLSTPNTKIKSIRNEYPIYTNVNTDQEEIAKQFEKYDLVALPVVNDDHQLVGLITVDDVVDIVIEEATEDLYRLSGTYEYNDNKLITGSVFHAVTSRLPWLIITIIGGFVASMIIHRYSVIYPNNDIPLAISLSFVPLLMGLAGNVGNQSATIIVRGLALEVIDEKKALKHVFKESMVGLVIGFIIALLVFIFNTIANQAPLLPLIVSVSLFVNVSVGALIGAGLPMILKRSNIDPAVASAPFISTALDIIGQLIYFSISIRIILWLL
jgi:magnesium transporter